MQTLHERCVQGREDDMDAFLKAYVALLYKYKIAIVPLECDLLFSGWTRKKDKVVFSAPNWNLDLNGVPVFLPKRLHPLECLLFSASLFSLIKPLYSSCEFEDIDVTFSLQILPSQVLMAEAQKIEQPLWPIWAINDCADLWCNYRPWPSRNKAWKMVEGDFPFEVKLKFRKSWVPIPVTAPWMHLGLPIAFSNCKRRPWGREEAAEYYIDHRDYIDADLASAESESRYPLMGGWTRRTVPSELSNEELEALGAISCLPLLFPDHEPKRQYSDENCLTLYWASNEPLEEWKIMRRMFDSPYSYGSLTEYHTRILTFYQQFLWQLNGTDKKVIQSRLKKTYRQALRALGVCNDRPEKQWQHKACLLGAVYFAHETISPRDGNVDEFPKCEKRLLRILAPKADAVSFAQFVVAVLKKGSEYSKYLFTKDEQGIYLKKNYWEGFCHFCEERNLLLPNNRIQFLNTYLLPDGYIKGGSSTQKYTFTKTINKKRTTVCKVMPEMLKLVKEPSTPMHSGRTSEPAEEKERVPYESIVEKWKKMDPEDRKKNMECFGIPFCCHSLNLARVKATEKLMEAIFCDRTLKTGGLKMPDLFKINDMKCAYLQMLSAWQENYPVGMKLLLEIHRLVTCNTYSDRLREKGEAPGIFRQNNGQGVMVDRIKTEVQRLLEQMNDESKGNDLFDAAALLTEMESIRPFAGGNNRTAQLMMNYYLLTWNHPPIVIHWEDRAELRNAMETWQATRRLEQLVIFLKGQTEKTWSPLLHREQAE